MSTSKSLETENPTVAFQQETLLIGQTSFNSLHSITVTHKGMLEITGSTDLHNTFTLTDIDESLFLKNLSTERKKHPNQALLSQSIGLTQFAIAETLMNVENGKALVRFQESINALERSMDQTPSVTSTPVHLMLCYCYMEELMADFGSDAVEDFEELINDLLIELPKDTLIQSADACASRGERYFEGKLAPLGFNFFKQELFIRRQLQLIDLEHQESWQNLENTANNLSKRCHQKGWGNIAHQIAASLGQWKSELESTSDDEELDHRLAELAEFERAGMAYLSHNDTQSALAPFEKHTSLLKEIYADYPLSYYYGKLLIESYEQTIDIYNRLGHSKQVDETLESMISHTESLQEEHKGDEYLSNILASCYEGLAERKIEENKLPDAIALFESSLALSELLGSTEADFELYGHYQLETLKKLLTLTKNVGDSTKTIKFTEKADTLERKLSS